MAEEKELNAENAETDCEADAQSGTPDGEAAAEAGERTEEVKSPEELLRAEVEKLKKELDEEKDKYLRLDAEYYNYRTRSLKEKQEAYDNALINSVTDILSVVDNFERALDAQTEDTTYKKGIEMIFKQYTDILKKLGVEEIDALGKPFDPNLHNAVTQVEDDNFDENTVSQVFRKGYCLGKKVIRHAMVAVANP
jgi:molecular chaperone GrpE